MQNISFSWSKKNQNVFLDANIFSKAEMSKIFTSKTNALYFFQSKIWRVVKLLNQNLTRCGNFVSKSDAIEISNSESDKF